MSHIVNNRSALDEIVFRGRNKAYGAYVLRAEYEKTLFRALLIVIAGASFISLIGWLVTREEIKVPADTGQIEPLSVRTVVDLRPIQEKKETPEPRKKTPEPPANNNNTSSAAVYTISSEETLQKDTARDISDSPVIPVEDGLPGGGVTTEGTGLGVTDGSGIDDRIFNDYDEGAEMPEFEGGLKALRRFISDHIRHPGSQFPESSGGRVVARFVVDEQGRISSASIKHSGGEEYDKEVLRVVRMLPAFKTPGKMRGRPVKVYYDLPIKFRVE